MCSVVVWIVLGSVVLVLFVDLCAQSWCGLFWVLSFWCCFAQFCGQSRCGLFWVPSFWFYFVDFCAQSGCGLFWVPFFFVFFFIVSDLFSRVFFFCCFGFHGFGATSLAFVLSWPSFVVSRRVGCFGFRRLPFFCHILVLSRGVGGFGFHRFGATSVFILFCGFSCSILVWVVLGSVVLVLFC